MSWLSELVRRLKPPSDFKFILRASWPKLVDQHEDALMRAMTVPKADRERLAQSMGIPEDMLAEFNDYVIACAMDEIKAIKW